MSRRWSLSQQMIRLREQYEILFALIVVIPLAVGTYVAWEHRLLGKLGFDQNTFLFLATFALVGASFSYLRKLFYQVSQISSVLKQAAAGKAVEIEIPTQIEELREIEDAFRVLQRRYEKANRALYELIQELDAAKQLAEITYLGMGNLALIKSILEKAVGMLHATSGIVLLYNKNAGSFRRLSARHEDGQPIPEGWLKFVESLANEAMDGRRPLRIKQIGKDPRWRDTWGSPPRSCLVLSVGSGYEAIGVIALFDKKGHDAFPKEDEIILSILVNEVANALECSRLKHALQRCQTRLQEERQKCAEVVRERDRLAKENERLSRNRDTI